MSNEVPIPRCASSRKEIEQDAKHRHDNCMSCKAAPEYEVLWAEGMGHAWFCERHLKEWLKESVASCAKEGFSNKNCELNSVKKLDNKEASKKFGDNKNANILDSFLSKIAMPRVNKEAKKEKEEEWHKQESVGLQDEDELAPVNSSGTKSEKEITLEEILPFFKSFYKAKPYVSLVGGLANNGKTKGDIDVFIRSNKEDVATEFRLYRMFPDELRSRIHILYPTEDNPGVYTNFIDLFDLKLEGRNVKHVELMAAIDERKGIKLFTFTKLLKPAHGRFKGELYSIDSLIELVNKKPEWYEKGIYVQKKFDGVHVRCDVKEENVKIWTEEGNEITKKLPTLVAALGKASKGHKIVLVGELEFWKDKEHQSRQETTAIIHTKEVHPEEKNVVVNFFDILFYDGDIHKEAYFKRREYLAKIETSEHVKATETRLAENETDLKNAVKRFANMPGSEGAYLKRADFPYELDGKTMLNLKYKNTFSIDARVEDVREVKGGKSWNYGCSINAVSGRKVAIGRTYNTGIRLKVGDIVKVEFVNLNKYFDTKTKKIWYNWWSPRVIMAREDKKRPDNIDTADKLVKESHGEDKDRRTSIDLDADEYMSPPDEAKTWLGMLHIHGRGKSVHGDLRFQMSKDWAIGWTLYIPKGLSKVPESYSEFVELVKKEVMSVVETKLKDPTKRFNCGKKEPEPAEWLDYKGMVEPGEIGACFSANTQILTSRGLKTWEEIDVGNLVYTHRGRWRPVTEKIETGNETRTCYAIHSHSGQKNVIITEDHPLLLAKCKYEGKKISKHVLSVGWITPKELFDKNQSHHIFDRYKLAIPRTQANAARSEEEGLLVGFVLGDGHIREDARIELCFNEYEGRLARFYQHLLTSLDIENRLNRIRKGGEKEINGRTGNFGNYIEISFTSKRIRDWVLGLRKSPESIFLYSKAFSRGVIDGLLDSDGYKNIITQKKPEVGAIIPLATLHSDKALSFRTDERTAAGTYLVSDHGLNAASNRDDILLKSFTLKPAPTPPKTFNLSVDGDESYYVPNSVFHNTKNEPGFFYIADRFNVEFGANKPHYHEYFCNGRLFNGRFCIRLLENKEEWKKTGEGLMTWMAVAAKDKTPYVISRRAVTKKWIPGFGHSALPKKMRLKVPEKYRYWRYKETSKQLEVRDELVDELGKTLVAGDALGPAVYKVFRQTWKGPTVVREGPARTRYYFAICQDTKGSVKFALATQNNPLENKELAGVTFTEAPALCALNAKVTEVKPRSKLNTTDNTPSKIELLERGAASIVSNTSFRRFRLRDGKLEGTWIAFQREEGSTIWTLKLANPDQ